MASMNLDDATQRIPTVKSHLTHRYHKILIELLKYTLIPGGGGGGVGQNSSQPENYIERRNWKHLEEKLRSDMGLVKLVWKMPPPLQKTVFTHGKHMASLSMRKEHTFLFEERETVS